ncbi:Hypothetical protein ACI5QM_01902 [Bacillus subtilis]
MKKEISILELLFHMRRCLCHYCFRNTPRIKKLIFKDELSIP